MKKKYLILFLSLFVTITNLNTSFLFAEEEMEEIEDVEVIAEEQEEPDYSLTEGMDFSSKRFIVCGDASIFTKEDHIIGQFDNYYLLQYESVEEARDAYIRLYESASFIDVDDEIILKDCSDASPIYMDETSSPFVNKEIPASKIVILGKEDQSVVDTIYEYNPSARVTSIPVFDVKGKSSVSSLYAAIKQAIRAGVEILYFPQEVNRENHYLIDKALREAMDQGILVVGNISDDERAVVIGACDEYGQLVEEPDLPVNYKVIAKSYTTAGAIFVALYAKNNQIKVDNAFVFEPDAFFEEEIVVANETARTILFTVEEGQAIVDYAKQLYDAHATTYHYGGRSYTSAARLDCSGFVNHVLMKAVPSKAKSYSYSGNTLNDGKGGSNSGTKWWSGFLTSKGVAKETIQAGERNIDLSHCSPGDIVILYEKSGTTVTTHHIGFYAGDGMVYHCTIGPVDLGNDGPANDGIHYDQLEYMPDVNCSKIDYYTIFHCAQEVPYVNLEGYSLTLDGAVGMNFYVQNSETAQGKTDIAYLELNGEQKIYPDQAPVVQVNGRSCRKFTYKVSAKNMTEKVSAQIHYNDGKTSKEYVYSVEDCADYIINHPGTYGAKDISMAKALLTYGKYTQEYFEYNLANLPKNVVPLEDMDFKKYQHYLMDTNEDIEIVGARLILATKPGLKIYLKGDASFCVDGMEVESVKEGQYTIITISDIDHFDHMYNITADNFYLSYGIYSFGYSAMKDGKTSLSNIVKAMALYQKSMDAY